MSLVDELARLEEMRARGTLSEDEFQRAKARLIDAGGAAPQPAAPITTTRQPGILSRRELRLIVAEMLG